MGGQLGSSSSTLADCIAAPQKYCSRKLAVSGRSTLVRRIGRRPNSGVRPNPSLRQGQYVPFSGIKKGFFGKKKLLNKILKVHAEKIAKTKNKLWLRVTQLESQPQIKLRNSNLSRALSRNSKSTPNCQPRTITGAKI